LSRAPEPDEATVVELAAVRLLAGREHSRLELQRKLAARQRDGAIVDSVLDGLERQGLLSDARFVENYVEQRSRKGYGPLRIRAELAGRGIDGELVADGFDAAGIDWEELLAGVALRKFGDQPAADARELARRGRFLEQRGFPVGLVRRYLDRVRGA
jgi:regulatory protein